MNGACASSRRGHQPADRALAGEIPQRERLVHDYRDRGRRIAVGRLKLTTVQDPRAHRLEEPGRNGEPECLRPRSSGELEVVRVGPAPEKRPCRQARALDAWKLLDSPEKLAPYLSRLR